MNHVCKVVSRLLSQRLDGVGKIIHGIVIARTIRGIPSNEGLRN